MALSYRTQDHGRVLHTVSSSDGRLRMVALSIILMGVGLITRLGWLMLIEHESFVAEVEAAQDVYAPIFPKRGHVFIQDSRTKEEFPLAMNKDTYVVFADTREIPNKEMADTIAQKLAAVFEYSDEKKFALYQLLLKPDDPYEPIERKVEESVVDRIRELHLPGIAFDREAERYYPEGNVAASVIGFVGKTDAGKAIGRYGVEGYWEETLAGSGGFEAGARSASGRWIPLAGRTFKPVEHGADMVLTIDRAIQFYACERLRQGLVDYGATSASLIIMDPRTGAIRAMCSVPDFDPNTYNKVDSVTVYNNSTIFTPYEPGSIFKPLTMVAAINEGLVSPDTPFYDSGSREGLCKTPIRNAGQKVYRDQTMIGVLENSINTGMIFVAEKLGKERFRHYVEQFGFGLKTGIELNTEAAGTIDSLSKNKGDTIDCYAANGSFGQGLTVTPLQITTAFAAIANGGMLMKPYVVDEIRYANGRVVHTEPRDVRRVVTSKAASLLAGMMVNVVDRGHARLARVPHYYVAGKTGTAQIPGKGGYNAEETNHSLIGFAPADNPVFVMLVKYEKPNQPYAESTAAPVFGDIAKFLLRYYEVPPER